MYGISKHRVVAQSSYLWRKWTQATLMDSQYEEHVLVEEIGPDDDDATVPQNIIILTNDEIKKPKADALKKQLETYLILERKQS